MITFAAWLLLACSSTPSYCPRTVAWSLNNAALPPNHYRQHRRRPFSTKLVTAAAAHRNDNFVTKRSSNHDSGSTAIILNLNARSVVSNAQELISLASEIVGENHVYVTRTVDDAVLAARMVVRQGQFDATTDASQHPPPYSLVVPVGGDGTLSGWIDSMVKQVMLLEKLTESSASDYYQHHEVHNHMKVQEAIGRLPMFGYIPMGTGNAMSYVIGCCLPKTKSEKNDNNNDKNSVDDGNNSNNEKKKWVKKLMSRLSLKRRKLEHAGRVMRKLKRIGDELQQQKKPRGQNNGGSEEYSVVEMPLMEVTHHSPEEQYTKKGDLCFFAGAGFDSLMLEDFKQVKAWSKSSQRTPPFIKDMFSSVAGYCVALVTKTLPQTLMHSTHKIKVKVTTTDPQCLWVDHRRGDFSELANKSGEKTTTTATKRSHVIYEGMTGILAVSTTPFYGGGLRLFPYARLFPGKMQLRIGRISPLTGFLRIPAIFEGSYRDKSESFGCLDFIGDDFEVEVSSTRYEEYLKRKYEQKEQKQRSWRWWKKKSEIMISMAPPQSKSTSLSSSSSFSSSQKGFPFQHSGESMGIKERFRVRVTKQPVKFISFLKPRIVVDE